ncbi:response regulator transcription factor [Nonomuraea cavernae]|uniref:DNA-binding response regulator n=1 Tax=Nonomuraea cavernae TaxID=2045107 RepID=A0A917Z981_9ACTN|nr:response regulator transcription factor [Nonomuraea cavernae]MCA2189206.1 response regulator transcription factor [Nonomuraea cavernae]GGO76726.1 DNA-binding response regulator [Nonomuraea cavernae]
MIRTLLAEDMHLVRGAIVALLAYEEDIEVVAEVDRGDRIVATACAVQPDVAVIDVGLPGKDGLVAAGELHEKLPACGVLILTGVGTPGLLRRALDAHVRGFMAKDAPPSQLADAIRRVSAGERVIDSEIAIAAMTPPDAPLTARELDVIGAAAEGASVSEIAASLFLSKGTVRNYLHRSTAKLGARSRIDAIRIARESGWI